MSELISKHCPGWPDKVSYKGVDLEHNDVLIVGEAESWPKAYGCDVELSRGGKSLVKEFIWIKPYAPERPYFWSEGKRYIYAPKGIKMSECFNGLWAFSGEYLWDQNELRFVKAR